MSSATTTSPAISSEPPLHGAKPPVPTLDELERMTSVPDERHVIKDVDWAFYERLADSIPAGANIHVDYDGKDLEIMALGPFHDGERKLCGQLVEAIAQELEIWRFDGKRDQVVIERLGEDGSYHAVEDSMFLPIRAAEIRRWVVEEDTSDEPAWARRLRAWARAELAPRLPR